MLIPIHNFIYIISTLLLRRASSEIFTVNFDTKEGLYQQHDQNVSAWKAFKSNPSHQQSIQLSSLPSTDRPSDRLSTSQSSQPDFTTSDEPSFYSSIQQSKDHTSEPSTHTSLLPTIEVSTKLSMQSLLTPVLHQSDRSTIYEEKREMMTSNSSTYDCLGESNTWSSLSWVAVGQDIKGDLDNDIMGSAVAISEDATVIVVGAPGFINSYTGSTRVFTRTGNGMIQLGDDIIGPVEGSKFGYSVATSSDGLTVIIGAPFHNEKTGMVEVYQYDDSLNNWIRVGQQITGTRTRDRFGNSVSMSNDGQIIIIGANMDNGAAALLGYENRGVVRAYQYDTVSSSWEQIGQDLEGSEGNERTGWSVSLSSDGHTLAYGGTKYGTNRGVVRIFHLNETETTPTWEQVGADVLGERNGDHFGFSVSLSSDGTIVAIGAHKHDGGGDKAGHVQIYQLSGSSWLLRGQSIEGQSADDMSGFSVSLSSDGSIVAIGAPYNEGDGIGRGETRVYRWSENDTNWMKIGDDINGDADADENGSSVALSSDGLTLIVGSPRHNSDGTLKGMARVYNVASCNTVEPSPIPSSLPTLAPSRIPSSVPTLEPSLKASSAPSLKPSLKPSSAPSLKPSLKPSETPSLTPSSGPSLAPSLDPSSAPSLQPSSNPSLEPSLTPSTAPSLTPSAQPSLEPSLKPTSAPSLDPSSKPSQQPSLLESPTPSLQPSTYPSLVPSSQPSSSPSIHPTSSPSSYPSLSPSIKPTDSLSQMPSTYPSSLPTKKHSMMPSASPFNLISSQSAGTINGLIELDQDLSFSLNDENFDDDSSRYFSGTLKYTTTQHEFSVAIADVDCHTIVPSSGVAVTTNVTSNGESNAVEVALKFDQESIESSPLWTAGSNGGVLNFCLIAALIHDNGAVADAQRTIYNVEIDMLAGFNPINSESSLSRYTPNEEKDYLDYEASVAVYLCDSETQEEIVSHPPFTRGSILTICLSIAPPFIFEHIYELHLTQLSRNGDSNSYDAIIPGGIINHQEVVMSSCSFTSCVAEVFLLGRFFEDDEPLPISLNGQVFIEYVGADSPLFDRRLVELNGEEKKKPFSLQVDVAIEDNHFMSQTASGCNSLARSYFTTFALLFLVRTFPYAFV